MYTYINMNHSVTIIEMWFNEFKDELPVGLSTQLIIKALKLLILKNMFEFGNTCF